MEWVSHKFILAICSWYCIISSSVAYFHKKTKRYCIKKFSLSVSDASVWCESITVSIFASYQSYCSSFQILQFPPVAKFYIKTNRYMWKKLFVLVWNIPVLCGAGIFFKQTKHLIIFKNISYMRRSDMALF